MQKNNIVEGKKTLQNPLQPLKKMKKKRAENQYAAKNMREKLWRNIL